MTRLIAVAVLLTLAACAPANTANTYSREQMGRAATVMKGKVTAVRDVKVSGTQSGLGAGAGAAGGAVAGSTVGGGARSNILGAIGGAVVGGVAGAVAEGAATAGGAVEFIIHQDNGQDIAVVQTNEDGLKIGDTVLILRSDKVRVIKDQTAAAS